MFYLSHNLHLRIDLLVQDSVLHKSSLLKLLCCIWDSIELSGHLVDYSKGALANAADLIVLSTTLPLLDMSADRRQIRCIRGPGSRGREKVELAKVSTLRRR